FSKDQGARDTFRAFAEELCERRRFRLADHELHERGGIKVYETHGRSSRSRASARLARRDARFPMGLPKLSRSPRPGVARPAAIRRSRVVDRTPAGARTATRCPRSFTSRVSPFLTRRR